MQAHVTSMSDRLLVVESLCESCRSSKAVRSTSSTTYDRYGMPGPGVMGAISSIVRLYSPRAAGVPYRVECAGDVFASLPKRVACVHTVGLTGNWEGGSSHHCWHFLFGSITATCRCEARACHGCWHGRRRQALGDEQLYLELVKLLMAIIAQGAACA
jgi:hypothetical protein